MKTKLVIFDLDGTLLNTAKNLQFCVNQALKEYGKPLITLKQTVAFVGNGAKKLIERAVGDDERVDDVFNTFMNNCLFHFIKRFKWTFTFIEYLLVFKMGIRNIIYHPLILPPIFLFSFLTFSKSI